MEIPKLGLWTRKVKDKKIIEDALSIGYRHFDTAWIYGNEKLVGEAINDSWIQRDKLWITTKVWFDYVPNYQEHTFIKSDFWYTQLDERLKVTFHDLGDTYIDLVLLHWPTYEDNDAYAFEKLLTYKKEGRINHVWVSNFPKKQLELLYNRFWDQIEYEQVEKHACLGNTELEQFCKDKGVQLVAYSPLWHGHLLKSDTLITLAKKEKITVAQLCIAYLLAKGVTVIPKASSYERLLENYWAKEITLCEETMKEIDKLEKHYRYNNPPFAPEWE